MLYKPKQNTQIIMVRLLYLVFKEALLSHPLHIRVTNLYLNLGNKVWMASFFHTKHGEHGCKGLALRFIGLDWRGINSLFWCAVSIA